MFEQLFFLFGQQKTSVQPVGFCITTIINAIQNLFYKADKFAVLVFMFYQLVLLYSWKQK